MGKLLLMTVISYISVFGRMVMFHTSNVAHVGSIPTGRSVKVNARLAQGESSRFTCEWSVVQIHHLVQNSPVVQRSG